MRAEPCLLAFFVIPTSTWTPSTRIRLFLTQIRVDGILSNSGERFQKETVLVNGFTGFLRWMED